MLRDWNHTEIWDNSPRRFWWKSQISLDHILKLISRLLHCFVDYNPVHGTAKVQVDFLKDGCCVYSTAIFIVFSALYFFLKIASRKSHGDNTVLLL